MLSKKAKYAIKALLALADRGGDEPMRIADLAREARRFYRLGQREKLEKIAELP